MACVVHCTTVTIAYRDTVDDFNYYVMRTLCVERRAQLMAAARPADCSGVTGAGHCAENGGSPEDELTTCDGDRGQLLDRIFRLAKARDLDLDFHVDENPNQEAKGLRYVALKTIEHGYQGRVVCGHCWCASGL